MWGVQKHKTLTSAKPQDLVWLYGDHGGPGPCVQGQCHLLSSLGTAAERGPAGRRPPHSYFPKRWVIRTGWNQDPGQVAEPKGARDPIHTPLGLLSKPG